MNKDNINNDVVEDDISVSTHKRVGNILPNLKKVQQKVYDKLHVSADSCEVVSPDNYIRFKGFDSFKKLCDSFDDDFKHEESLSEVLTLEYRTCFDKIKEIVPCELSLFSNSRYFFKYKNSTIGLLQISKYGVKKISFSLNVYGSSYEDVVEIFKTVESNIKPYVLDEEHINLRWLYINANKQLDSYHFQQSYKDVVFPEAYPYIKNFEKYVRNFVTGEETLLIFQGVPGTGKTRFIRHLLKELSRHYEDEVSDDCYFGFTNNPLLIDSEDFYMRFLLDEDYVGMILEDSDVNIKSRKALGGNKTINKMLFASDGFIPHNKKIILSTNLDMEKIDSAIIRSGRCYDFVKTRKLTPTEAQNLTVAYNNHYKTNFKTSFNEDVALCDVYREINKQAREL